MKYITRKQSGFTMIELLIVIVILGLLASLVFPKMFSKVDSSKRKIAVSQMRMLETSLDTYRLDLGDYPQSLSLLLASNEINWDGPYLPKKVPLDPWGNPYVYKIPGENGAPFYLASYAKDGQPGGKEDDQDLLHQ
jgi:general secretion pathway protein G